MKILILRFSSIGDIVLTSPVVRTIKTQLEDENQAWYKAATKVLKKSTAEGDMIRSQVPVTSSGPAPLPQTTLTNGPLPDGNLNGTPGTSATPAVNVTPAPVPA